ncbi:hypothetical protein [Laspinema olomoucense]|uniref:ribonuclease toxin HepT-like protein n=1 Tax=Laspinema olomoucense TaxID=3231600 RepID=UPI0021BBA352|nr:hypothetical protein [Laspinema sp. D3c]MCT7995246.1 hypothetical protein [Laspinema sp. D3c]
MNRDELLLLVGEIHESRVVLGNIQGLYAAYEPDFRDEQKRDIRDAVMLADIFCNTYTCVETILFRISRVFENHLDAHQWHKELLRKMRIEVPGIRKAVLSRDSYTLLDELRRFRHFKRYYYDFDYDWSRLDYLKSVYERLQPLIDKDLEEYIDFLLTCANEDAT